MCDVLSIFSPDEMPTDKSCRLLTQVLVEPVLQPERVKAQLAFYRHMNVHCIFPLFDWLSRNRRRPQRNTFFYFLRAVFLLKCLAPTTYRF